MVNVGTYTIHGWYGIYILFDYMDFQLQLFQNKSYTVASLLAQHQPKMSINDQTIVPGIFKKIYGTLCHVNGSATMLKDSPLGHLNDMIHVLRKLMAWP